VASPADAPSSAPSGVACRESRRMLAVLNQSYDLAGMRAAGVCGGTGRRSTGL